MKRFVALCIVAVAFATAPAFGGWEEGKEAYNKGDYKTALRELEPDAEKGDAQAQVMLGIMYNQGLGVLQDYKQAVKLYRLAAEQGNENAQFFLGIKYSLGQGIIQDDVRAHMWFNIAASNGNKRGIEGRDLAEEQMTPEQIEEARDLARACVAKDYKGC